MFVLLLVLPLLVVIGLGVVVAYHVASTSFLRKDQEIQTLQYQIQQLQEHIHTLTSFVHPSPPGNKRF